MKKGPGTAPFNSKPETLAEQPEEKLTFFQRSYFHLC